jgi:hypothetical protein
MVGQERLAFQNFIDSALGAAGGNLCRIKSAVSLFKRLLNPSQCGRQELNVRCHKEEQVCPEEEAIETVMSEVAEKIEEDDVGKYYRCFFWDRLTANYLTWISRGLIKRWLEQKSSHSMAFQPSQPLLCVFNFSEAGISIFPEGKEFFVMFDGFGRIPLILKDLSQLKKS